MGIRGSPAKASLAGRSWSAHHKFKSLCLGTSCSLFIRVEHDEIPSVTLHEPVSLWRSQDSRTTSKKAYFEAELSTERD